MQAPAISLKDDRLPWWLLGAGVLALLLPSALQLSKTLWDEEAYAHGPIVLAILAWVVYKIRPPSIVGVTLLSKAIGFVLLVGGLGMYIVGRSQNLPVIDLTAFLPILVGAVLMLGGKAALRVYWFPLLFMVFLIPLPGFLLDMMTLPLKEKVSVLAESLLYQAGLPIGRSGVMLTIGQYQLMVADACSGLNSMFSLSAMGILYLYLMGHKRPLRNVILVLLILPIAFMANLIRVMFLILLTYYFGDEAGQGFLHGFAGMFLFVIALSLLFAIDNLLGRFSLFANPKGAA